MEQGAYVFSENAAIAVADNIGEQRYPRFPTFVTLLSDGKFLKE